MTAAKKKNRSRPPAGKNARRSSGRKTVSAKSDSTSDITSRLMDAVSLYHEKEFDAAYNIWSEMDGNAEPGEWQVEYCRLGSYLLAHRGRFVESEQNALRGLQLAPDHPDFHFVLAYIYVTLRDYGKCVRHAHAYLELPRRGQQSTWSAPDEYLIHNYLGTALQALDDLVEAESAFRKAMELAPSYHHPYVNLANLYIRARKFTEADSVIKAGLQKCSQVQELRLLKKSLENRATVSACMIVKNEEEFLPNCLESIRSWVDEIIVVDTGSTDRTVEIAQSYGAKVFHQAWEGDFSKARNFSLAQATKEWIFIIDADEEFVAEDIPLIRQVMAQNQFRLVSINVYNVNRETGDVTSFLPSYRLYRRDAGFYYDGIVHNQLKYAPDEAALRVGVRLKHYGYSLSPERMKQKLARSRSLLEQQIAANPDDPYPHFNYAQLLRGTGINLDKETCDLIIKHASLAVAMTVGVEKYVHVHLMSLHQLITTHLCLKNYEEAEKLCHSALAIRSDYLDAVMSLGHLYTHMRRFADARKYFEKYLELQAQYDESKETSNLILLYLRARHIAHYGLGLIAQAEGNREEAFKYYLKVASEYGRYLDTFLRLARIALHSNQLSVALDFARQELQWHPDSALAKVYLGEAYVGVNDQTKAVEYYGQALQSSADNPEVFERAGCFFANCGRVDVALAAFKKLNSLVPNYPTGLKLQAKAAFDAQDYATALDSYERLLEIGPAEPEVLNDIANCYYRLNDLEKAEEYYQKALATGANLAVAYRNLGLVKMKTAKLDEAFSLFETYLKAAPDDHEIQLATAALAVKAGRFGDAIPLYEKYLKFNPGSVEGLYGISECYFNLGHIDSAAIGYNQVLKLNPDFQPARERLRQIHAVGTPA